MSNFRRQILLNALKLSDLVIMSVAFALATVPLLGMSRTVSLAEFFAMRVKVENFLIFAVLLLAWHLVFSAFGLYKSHRISTRVSEVADVLMSVTAGTLCVACMALRVRMVTLPFLITFWLLSGLMMVAGRLAMRIVLAQIRLRGRNLRDVLIVGTNSRAIQFARKLQATPELGYRILGFVDRQWGGIAQLESNGYSLLCEIDSLPEFLRNNVIDEVVIALPMRSLHDESSRVAALCEQHGLALRLLSNPFNLKIARGQAEDIEGEPQIAHYTGISEGWPLAAKRILDFTLALLALIVLAPALLITAIFIKLTSPGPVLFVQKRIGLNKRTFSIYKFRTMVADAEEKIRELEHLNEVSGPVFKIKADPRITPIGRILRKTSIDELPQLINVLKGDMSMVGPRPLPVRDYKGFNTEDSYRRRFSVRPGITCLWQVAGRSSIPFEQWMELDLQYIDKWSIWLDVQILAMTIPAVFRGSGAA